jgi:ketosteroid isomerase-like protein
MGVSSDLAYAFGIEHGTVRPEDVAEPAPMVLRVIHGLRREGGGWKLLHRHADPQLGKQAAETVIRQ